MSYFARIDGVIPGTSLAEVESFFPKKGVAVKCAVQFYESIDSEGNPSLFVVVKFESPEARKVAICTANGKKINARGKAISITPAYFGSIINLDDCTEEEDIIEFFRKSKISNMVDCILSRDDSGASVGVAEIVFSDKTGLDKAVKEITGKRIYKHGNGIRITAANPTKNLSAATGQVKLASVSQIKSNSSELPKVPTLAIYATAITKSVNDGKSSIISKAPEEVVEVDAQQRHRSLVDRRGISSLMEKDIASLHHHSVGKDYAPAPVVRKQEVRRPSIGGNSTPQVAASSRSSGLAAGGSAASIATSEKTASIAADIEHVSSSDSNQCRTEPPSAAKSQSVAKQDRTFTTATKPYVRTSSPTKARSSKLSARWAKQ